MGLPRTGKLVPNDVAKLIRNEVNEQVVFPIGDNKVCDHVNYNLEQYLVDDPNDCKKFYSCVREYNGAYRMLQEDASAQWAWRAYHMSCPQGTVFDGTTCQVGVTCLTYKDIDEHSIENESIEKSKKLSLENDVDLVDFIEDPVDIVDTSSIIEEEFDTTDDELSTDTNEEIISAKGTPTIIKVIPINEFKDVENNQIRVSLDRNTIVKKIPTESKTNFVDPEVLKTTEMTSSDELEITTFTESTTTSFEKESLSTTESARTLKPEITSATDSETELMPTLVESELTRENISIEPEMTSVADTMKDMISTSVEPEDLKIAEENTSVEPEIISFADSVTETIITSVNPEMLIKSEETTSVQPERTSFTNSVAELMTTSVEPELLISTEDTTSVDTDMTSSADYLTSDEPDLTEKEDVFSVKKDVNTIADPKAEMITTLLKPEETSSAKPDTTSLRDSVTELITTSVETELLIATEESTSVNQEMPSPADSLTELIATSEEPELMTTEEATSIQPDMTTFADSMRKLVNTSTEPELSLKTV